MFFIHETTCISPQHTFLQDKIFAAKMNELNQPADNILLAVEPTYEGIPPGVLRRMGRAVRLGVGAALPLLNKITKIPDGIIIGTSMGGMEDCVKFLIQIIDYNEGTLTPTNFVQSTPNAIAGQLGLLSKNKGYNITHVHRGFSFENAAIDVDMLLKENPGTTYLVGAVDEVSSFNYNIEKLAGWYKQKPCTNEELYNLDSSGSVAGEGSAMFIVNDDATNALAKLSAVHIFQTEDEDLLKDQLEQFLKKYFGDKKPGLLLSGESGDNRLTHFYNSVEQICGETVSIARYKHLSGEHPTTSGFACWIATEIIKRNELPEHMIKKLSGNNFDSILIYNNYKGIQHSFMLIEKV
ncbi:MAG: beta-ketoacyl synthase chain length factor [Ferruginibacter sp.]